MKYIKLRHEVVAANWDDNEGVWNVTVKDVANESTFVDTAEILVNNSGVLKYVCHVTYVRLTDHSLVTGNGRQYKVLPHSRGRYVIPHTTTPLLTCVTSAWP